MEKAGLKLNRPVEYTIHPPFPKNIMFELANVCNSQCVFCGYKDMERVKGFCDKEFTMSLMAQAFENGSREIGFYLIGEPFVNKDLAEYVGHAKKLGYEYIYLTTNGVLATPENMKAVIEAGLDSIKFSVNGATKQSYQKVHGKDDFEKVKSNIIWLRKYLDDEKIKLKTFISFVKCNFNNNDVEQLYKVFECLVDKIYIFDCTNEGGSINNLIENGIVSEVIAQKAPCDMVFNRLHVTVEGFLDACCSDVDGKLVYADLHKMSLLEAWNCETIVALRKQHLCGITDVHNCYNCINNTNLKVKTLMDLYGNN